MKKKQRKMRNWIEENDNALDRKRWVDGKN